MLLEVTFEMHLKKKKDLIYFCYTFEFSVGNAIESMNFIVNLWDVVKLKARNCTHLQVIHIYIQDGGKEKEKTNKHD